MRIVPVLPPEDLEVFRAEAVRIYGCAKHLKIELDPEGFVRAFQQDNMRLFIATDKRGDDEHHVVGMGMMAFGAKWFDQDRSATVMFCEGDARNELLRHMKETCVILKCKHFLYEQREGDTLGGDVTPLRHLFTY